MIAPVAAPKHSTFDWLTKLTAKIGGCVMVNVSVLGPQLLASVTVSV